MSVPGARTVAGAEPLSNLDLLLIALRLLANAGAVPAGRRLLFGARDRMRLDRLRWLDPR